MVETFLYNGYDYEVDLAALERSNSICYVWENRIGWVCLKLAYDSFILSVTSAAAVNERPVDSLVAPHRGSANLRLRICERTTSNGEVFTPVR